MHHEVPVTVARASAPRLHGRAARSSLADLSRPEPSAPFADVTASSAQSRARVQSKAGCPDVAASSAHSRSRVQSKAGSADVTASSAQSPSRVQSKAGCPDVTASSAQSLAWSLLLVALCVLTLGCAGDNAVSQTGPAASAAGASGMNSAAAGASAVANAGSAGAQPSAAGAPGAGKLSFANDVFPKVIRGKCGACHNDAPSFGGLAFFPGGPEFAYMNLVNTPSGNQEGFKCKDSGLMRVQPGDPEHSLMYLKLTNPPCGSKMPPGAFGTTTPEQAELVRQWIADGAAP